MMSGSFVSWCQVVLNDDVMSVCWRRPVLCGDVNLQRCMMTSVCRHACWRHSAALHDDVSLQPFMRTSVCSPAWWCQPETMRGRADDYPSQPKAITKYRSVLSFAIESSAADEGKAWKGLERLEMSGQARKVWKGLDYPVDGSNNESLIIIWCERWARTDAQEIKRIPIRHLK